MVRILEDKAKVTRVVPISDDLIEVGIDSNGVFKVKYYNTRGTGKDATRIVKTIDNIRKHSGVKAYQWILRNPNIQETNDISADFIDDGYSIPDEYNSNKAPSTTRLNIRQYSKSYIVTATIIDSRDKPIYDSIDIEADSEEEAIKMASKKLRKKYPRSMVRDLKVVERFD